MSESERGVFPARPARSLARPAVIDCHKLPN